MGSPPPPAYNQDEADARQLMSLYMLHSFRRGPSQRGVIGSTNSTNASGSERRIHNTSLANEARRRQQEVSNPSDDEDDTIWNTIIKGLAGIVVIGPVTLVAGISFAIGSVLLGLGQVLQGVGTFLTWGYSR